ncbi:RNA 2',3'-cyclic phosphodiesterase [Bacillus sp. ISL-35]|uniref:RNA 2',3'-cyclic phosphodiesterase n=1 Tax=Bacillus sp. ISL-35 TaxID=2819122 RepID=UPI001BEBB9E0|nr:RNA 2',3'-cyclic phosphodiesterase [Bacillus sp. ISL-35]MBT2680744.1 RNA 2',3'-cyclic phosphodiesterase [Bacillus sp. ISL-35]MBT2705553.1 RNA 2',3'-cyclic phosphodiesterase [Chryseobacterium sp. ISL-80]
MGQHAHFFYALEVPGEVKEVFKSQIEHLQEELPFKTWVHPQDLHITLAFLGNAPDDKMEAASERIEAAMKLQTSFELKIDHLGIFGRSEAPRIFWAGLKDSQDLKEVRQDVFSACLDAGFTLEKRPFSPHITIARKWVGEAPFYSAVLGAVNPFKNEEISFQAGRVVLYKTHLGKSPKYEPIKQLPLAPGV